MNEPVSLTESLRSKAATNHYPHGSEPGLKTPLYDFEENTQESYRDRSSKQGNETVVNALPRLPLEGEEAESFKETLRSRLDDSRWRR